MSSDLARAATQFFGGRVCLDFANTVDWRTSADPQELMPDYAALLSWSERRNTLPKTAVAKLWVRAAGHGAELNSIMLDVRTLRRQICTACDSLREERAVDLSVINGLLAVLPPQPGLIRHNDGYTHDLAGDQLRQPLWPVLWSWTALLASHDAARVGCCKAEGCGWFFVDESPNRSRLWCSSEVCGNRERARRAYSKRRSTV